MQKEQEHFIKNIEIKNFKCFENFKAEGFGRVNLIGGKNNVGKTAFMEACYLSQSKSVLDYFLKHIEFLTNRDYANQIYDFNNKDNDINNLMNNSISSILINTQTRTVFYINQEKFIYEVYIKNEKIEYTHDNLFNFLNFNIKNTKQSFSNEFIVSSNSYPNFMFDYLISKTKEHFQYKELNNQVKKIFNYDSIDILLGIPMVFQGKNNFPLHHLGQGIKTFIYNISSLLIEKDKILFFDEIDNGLHYSLFDEMWKIILKISKLQDVQVFATTHSKECIESYARVAKELKDEEVTFIELGRNKHDKLDSIVMDSEMFQRYMKMGNEVRGW